jgi:hypothetical protein
MAETPKLSVEKALEKLRSANAPKSKNVQRTEEMDALDVAPGPVSAARSSRVSLTGRISSMP